jgi:hypothetical protein
VAEETPRPIPEIIPETPAWLCGIIAKLHAKNPDQRFQSAREVADMLADCEAKLRAKQEVKNVYSAAANKPAGRKRMAAVAVLLLPVIALAALEFTGVTQSFRGQPPLPEPIRHGGAPVPGAVVKNEAPGVVEIKETPAPNVAKWTILKPIEMKSEGGATLTQQQDASILASGTHSDTDVYTLTFRALPTKVQSLRLEVLPHESLPNDGPGRHPSLAFVLTKVRAEVELTDKKAEPRELGLVKAWADSSGGDDSLPHFAIDMDDNTGWSAENGKAHFIVLELEAPVAVSEGTVLRVTLEFKHENPQRQLGCFRLSMSKDKIDANSLTD